MKLERKHAVLFLAIAAWNLLSYANFAKNLAETAASGADRATGYYVAHIVLIVVNVGIAVVLGRLGWKAWRATAEQAAPEQAAMAQAGASGPGSTQGTARESLE